MVFTAEELRAHRARKNYGRNALGKFVRKKAFRDCDYTPEGHLVQFDDEDGFVSFEEGRYTCGQHQAHYNTKVRSTVPKEQLALDYVATAEAINNDAAKEEGHETRVHTEQTAEGLHARHDEHQATLCEIRTRQLQQDEEQSAILEKKKALAEKQKERNEAFASRVEAGDCTPLEKKELRLKILQEEVRREKAEKKLEKQREKARRQSEKRALLPPPMPEGQPMRQQALPKKRRASQQLAPVLDGSASGGGGANGPLTLEGEALEQINGGLHEGFLDPGLQRELLEYFEEQLRNDEPYAVTMAGPRPFVLKHKKLMYGTLSDGMVPIYNFGLIYEDLRKTKPMPQLLQRVADKVERTFQQLPNNCVVNIYPSGGDEISPHQDQRFSDGNGRFESEQPVFIIRLGATRPLVLHTLDGRETREFQLESGDLYRLTGFVNTHFQHSVPAVENCGLCITLSFRLVSNEMYPSGRFAIINGKKRALAKNEREPCVANRPSSASPVPKQLRAIEPSLSTGTSRERSQGRNEDGDADAPKTRQGRRVSPMPTSPPEDVRLERVLSVKCPKLGLAMLGGEKAVENRKYELPLGWHWLYISKARDLKGLEEFKSQIDTLQYSSEEQDKCYSHVIGGIYIVAVRQPKDCNGNPWAKGPYCHVISHSLTLTQPVPIQKPGAISVRWTIKSEQERQLIRAQIPQGPPKAIDFQKALGERA